MKWQTVTFKMPKQELQELREFIQETPGVSLSGLTRNGIKMQMVEIKNDSESVKSSYQSTKLFEIVSDLFRKDFGWEDR